MSTMDMTENQSNRVTLIHQRLTAALNPLILNIEDDSQHHRNHPGAKESGGGHYSVYIVSQAFTDKSMVARHQMIYKALEGLIGPEIHAIQITAKTPEE